MKQIAKGIAIAVLLLAFLAIPVSANVTFISSTPQIITKGDPFTVHGSGIQTRSVAVWIIGKGYFDIRTVLTNEKRNFTLTIKSEETEKFPTGKYVIAVQEPGADGRMEIEPGKLGNGNLTIANRGKMIADIGPQENLPANARPIAEILHDAVNLQGVDDTFTTFSFFVEEPTVEFTGSSEGSEPRLPTSPPGERIPFTGLTNIAADDFLNANIQNLATGAPVSATKVLVIRGGDMNGWSFVLDAPGLPPGDYSLTMGWMRLNTTDLGSARFAVAEPGTAPTVTPVESTQQGGNTTPALPLPLIIIVSMVAVVLIITYATMKK